MPDSLAKPANPCAQVTMCVFAFQKIERQPVKFKMAENSLFAVLMRSRWWISFAICAAVVAISLAVFPKDISPFAALGAFPFFVVGCLAAWRQMRAPSAAKLELIEQVLRQQSWADFSTQIQAAWQAEGYEVQRQNLPGADWLLTMKGATTAVSGKRWKAAVQGVEPLRELRAATDKLQADRSVYLALSPLSDSANAFAKEQNIVVLDGTGMATLIAKNAKA